MSFDSVSNGRACFNYLCFVCARVCFRIAGNINTVRFSILLNGMFGAIAFGNEKSGGKLRYINEEKSMGRHNMMDMDITIFFISFWNLFNTLAITHPHTHRDMS